VQQEESDIKDMEHPAGVPGKNKKKDKAGALSLQKNVAVMFNNFLLLPA
jgi:hypothetical protein